MSEKQINPDAPLKIISAALKGDLTPEMVKFKREMDMADGYMELGLYDRAIEHIKAANNYWPSAEITNKSPDDWEKLKNELNKKMEKLEELRNENQSKST